MLEQKDLQAIAKLIGDSENRLKEYVDEKVTASETRMTARMAEEIAGSEVRLKEYVDEKVTGSETRLKGHVDEKVSTSQSHTLALMEAYFDPKFQALAEKIDLIEEKMVTYDDLEEIESRLDVLEAVVRRNSRDIEKLKKAQ